MNERVFPITIRRTFGSDPEIHRVVWGPRPGPNGEATVLQLYQAHRHLALKSPTRPDEKPLDLPLIGFGAFDQRDRKGLGCREHNLNPEGMHAIGLDYDDVTREVASAVLRLAKVFSPEGLAHSTWQHGLGAGVRMRVVLPLPEPIDQTRWTEFWHYTNRALGEHADQQCKNIGRLYYLPCVNLDAPAWARDSQDGGCWFESWGKSQ